MTKLTTNLPSLIFLSALLLGLRSNCPIAWNVLSRQVDRFAASTARALAAIRVYSSEVYNPNDVSGRRKKRRYGGGSIGRRNRDGVDKGKWYWSWAANVDCLCIEMARMAVWPGRSIVVAPP